MADTAPSTQSFDALAAEIIQLAGREIADVRASSTAPLDADALLARTRLEGAIHNEVHAAAQTLARLKRFVGYLREHAERVAATPVGSPLHETNVAPATPGSQVTR